MVDFEFWYSIDIQTLISRKIWVTENSVHFHTGYGSHLECKWLCTSLAKFLATLTKPNQLITTSGTGGGSYTPAATGNMSSSSCSYQMNHVLERSANQNTNATSRQTAIWQTEQQCPPSSSTSCPEYVRCPDKCVRTISSVPCPDDQSMKAANVAKPLTPWDLLKLDPLVNHTPLISTLDDWEKFLKMKPNRFLALCSRYLQNVKLRLDFVEIRSFYCHLDFTWNSILVNLNGPKMSFLAILVTLNFEF